MIGTLTKALDTWQGAIERDHGICQWCEAMGEAVHHMVHRSLIGGADREAVQNKVTLCGGCHRKAHKEPRASAAILLGIMADRYGYREWYACRPAFASRM